MYKAVIIFFIPFLFGCQPSENEGTAPDLLEPIGIDRLVFESASVEEGDSIPIGTRVYFNVKYEVASVDYSYIFVRSETCVGLENCYADIMHGSYQIENGVGIVIGWFQFDTPVTLSQVSFVMEDGVSRDVIVEQILDYSITWE